MKIVAAVLSLCAIMGLIFRTTSSDTQYTIIEDQHETQILKDGVPLSELATEEDVPYEIKIANKIIPYILEERYADGLEILLHELDSYPSDPWLLCSVAEMYERYLNQPTLASEYYEKAYQADPEFPWAVYQKSAHNLVNGDVEEGIRLLCSLVERMSSLSKDDQMYACYAIGYLAEAALANQSMDEINWLWSNLSQCDYMDSLELYACAVYVSSVKVAISYDVKDPSFSDNLKKYKMLLETSEFRREDIEYIIKSAYSIASFEKCIQLLSEME